MMKQMPCPSELKGPGIFFGIDASLTGSGICRLQDGVASCDTVKTTPKTAETDLERYIYIADRIMAEIPDNTQMVCMEDYYTPRNPAQMGAAIVLIAVDTHIRIRLFQRGIPFIIVSPTTLKKFVTGKGGGSKDVIIMHLYKRYGLEFSDNNQADSFGLAVMARAVYEKLSGSSHDMTKPQQESVKKVLADSKQYNIKELKK
jgi:crossover junction endodeoxyribonuclease RuvC